MSSTDDDPTTEEILTALRTIGIAGGSLDSLRTRRPEGTGEEGQAGRWSFWVKNKYCNRDDSPTARITSTTPITK